VFRWVIGGLLTAWMVILLLVVPLTQYIYGWDWRANALGVVCLVVFVAAVAFLRRREWARRVLLSVACVLILALLTSVLRLTLQDQPGQFTGPLIGLALCALLAAGLSLPSVKSGMLPSTR